MKAYGNLNARKQLEITIRSTNMSQQLVTTLCYKQQTTGNKNMINESW